MKRSLYYSTKAALGVCCFLLIYSCQPFNKAHIESNISRAKKDPQPYKIITKSSPSLLNTDELSTLLQEYGKTTSTSKGSKISKKVAKLFSTPFIDNSHFKKHGLPKPGDHPNLGKSLRVSTWNIEKSINVTSAANALSSEKAFIANLKPGTLKKQHLYNDAIRQRASLAASDILLCQEMDIGHCRSNYLFAAKHLAKKMGMNFVYAPQQLEIDPVHLGETDIKFGNKYLSTHKCNTTPHDYKGVFGVAVLSRYPIKRVQVFPLKTQPYDWYTGEIKKPDFLEKLRRYSTEKLFKFRPAREIKIGGRGFTRVDLHVPGVPHETLTVINIHLEIKAPPKQRTAQLKEILSYIGEIKNPVIMAGDYNNASRDVSATSVAKATANTIKNPTTIVSTGLHIADAITLSRVRTLVNEAKNFKNPLATHIPFILPNKKKSLFSLVESYRFKDGGAFDFRGDKERSINGCNSTLANSNQKTHFKRFTFTFSTPRTWGPIGRDRLDWIFVKSFLTHPKDKNGSYQLAPHYGETLSQMNLAVKNRYSDHHPITVLLPLNEPEL